VQGDNLLALKALLPYYAGKVKCIYIDPPYNTGNEGWAYNDNVNSPEIRRWLGEVVGKEGEDLSRHDKWLCMMYPRLALLRDFLTEDGAVFISIDDNESDNLRLVMDELFGRSNRVGTIVWKNATDNNPTRIVPEHEYVVCYARQISATSAVWKAQSLDVKARLLEVAEKLIEQYSDDSKLHGRIYDLVQREQSRALAISGLQVHRQRRASTLECAAYITPARKGIATMCYIL
jgi:adenine-specific DNA-methyltransferase